MSKEDARHFIIGGTEKAGTTSLFTYLSGHPDICGSNVKETNYFRDNWIGHPATDKLNYLKYFGKRAGSEKILMEASTAYLGAAEKVAERIHKTFPDAMLLFILRNPVDRLYSSFNFHQGRLNIQESMNFKLYVDLCMQYEKGENGQAKALLGDLQLKNLRFGNYYDFLNIYRSILPKENIKIMFFEHFKNDEKKSVLEICDFLRLNSKFYDTYTFHPVNVTFSGKNKALHKIAIYLNKAMEPFLRQKPGLKQIIVRQYKKINMAKTGYSPLPESSKKILSDYYQPGIEKLKTIIDDKEIPW